ncbi:MAG: hypothetical protein ABIN58_01630, partial [candidate division WOR-3 bacterium]
GLSLEDAGAGSWTSMGAVDWRLLTLVISILTMTLGNIAALRQSPSTGYSRPFGLAFESVR